MSEVHFTGVAGDTVSFKSASYLDLYCGWSYKDWEISPSQDFDGYWRVNVSWVNSDEAGNFKSLGEIDDPRTFPTLQAALAWVNFDAKGIGK